MENKEIKEEKNLVEEKQLNEEDSIIENILVDAEENAKIEAILRNVLDTKVTRIIEKELRKNKIERNLTIEISIDVDFYK